MGHTLQWALFSHEDRAPSSPSHLTPEHLSPEHLSPLSWGTGGWFTGLLSTAGGRLAGEWPQHGHKGECGKQKWKYVAMELVCGSWGVLELRRLFRVLRDETEGLGLCTSHWAVSDFGCPWWRDMALGHTAALGQRQVLSWQAELPSSENPCLSLEGGSWQYSTVLYNLMQQTFCLLFVYCFLTLSRIYAPGEQG